MFSPLYAWWIGLLGLENAARLLTLVFSAWFPLAASWGFSAVVAGRGTAWLAVAFLLIVGGAYGGAGVFRVLDPFLTARLPAEALIITALCCQVRGMKRLWLRVGARSIAHPPAHGVAWLTLYCFAYGCRFASGIIVGAIGGCIRDARHCDRRNQPAGSFACVDRHGRTLVGRGAGAFTISVLAALVDSRLGHQCAAVHVLGIHRSRGHGRSNTQTLRGGSARGSRRPGSGVHRRASSARSRCWCRVKPGGGSGSPSSQARRWFPSRHWKHGAMMGAGRLCALLLVSAWALPRDRMARRVRRWH